MKENVYFKFIEFNPRRAMRKVEAVRMQVDEDGSWLWMSKKDLEMNIKEFGNDPELSKGLECYK
jgi:hypothetical protein